mmetsp:Transcript_18809/g.31684  ORF Transcript_18809/g.31684 Transcript_18809/m.31684 type:complete len:106 (+) Transcript_18809:123-440(+)
MTTPPTHPSILPECWKYFRMYNRSSYPNKQNVAVCNICYLDSNKKNIVEIKIGGSSTTGPKRHLQSKHRKEYDEMEGKYSWLMLQWRLRRRRTIIAQMEIKEKRK